MSEERLIKALEDLTEKIDDMSEKLGRGKTKNSNIPGSNNAKSPEEKALAGKMNALGKIQDQGVDIQKKSNKANRDQTESTEKLTKAQEKAEKEQKKLEASMERAKDGLHSFGKSLLDEKSNFANAIGSLGGTLSRSYGVVGRMFGGMATGVGVAVGLMQNFAESAKDMGNFADLGAFQVGSVRQAKILSGLGDSFIKAIEQSNGNFKALGGTSQDAVENLSNLSRALRYGSSYLNSAMRKSLGTDLVKSVDKAARATAAMGLSQEDQANLQGSILASTMLNAKNEQDAQQKFVKALSDSVTSARNLSDAFGMSAKAVLAAMAEFRKTQAGTVASLEGNKGADQMYAILKQFPSLGTDPAKLANVAAAIAEGDMTKAQYNIRDNPESTQLLQQLFQASQGAISKEGLNVDKFNKNIEGLRGEIENEYESRKSMQGFNDKNAAPAIEAMRFLRERDIATGKIAPDKKAKEELTGKSEADNIQTMNALTAALESLRGSIIGLTAGILALLGPLVSIALSGGIGGMLATKGLMGTIRSILKLPVTVAMAAKEFYNASGGLKGMWESTKGFGKAILDSTKAMYTNVGGIKGMWEATKKFSGGVWEATKRFGTGLWDSTKALYANMGGIKGMWEATKKFGTTAWEATKTFGSGLLNATKNIWDAAGKFGRGAWEATKAMYANAGGIAGMLNSIKTFGVTLLTAGAQAAKSLWAMAINTIQMVIPSLIAMARAAWASMIPGLGGMGKYLGSLGKLLGPVIGWFARLGPWLARVGGIFLSWGSKLLPFLGGAFEILSGPIGWLIGAATLLYMFWDDIVDVSKAVWKGFTNLVSWLADGASAIWDVITSPFVALYDWLSDGAFKIWDIITSPFKALSGWISDSWVGKLFGSSDDTPAETSPVAANSTANLATTQQSAQPTSNNNGQIVGSIKPAEFASITTPNVINSDFGNTSANKDQTKATENGAPSTATSSLTPEALAQLMSYLSDITSDLAAIRSNTKTDSFSAPVRLS